MSSTDVDETYIDVENVFINQEVAQYRIVRYVLTKKGPVFSERSSP